MLWGIGIEIHRILLAGLDLVDKFSIPASEVQNTSIVGNKSSEETLNEDTPDGFSVIEVLLKALGVNPAQIVLAVRKHGEVRRKDET